MELMFSMMPGGPLDNTSSGRNLANTRKNIDGQFQKPSAANPTPEMMKYLNSLDGKLPSV